MSIPFEISILYDDFAVNTDDQEKAHRQQPSEDAAFVARAQTGDADAFEALVRRYRNDVYALSYHFVRNREEAWDISQEVFIKAFRSLRRYRGDAEFKNWLFRITANHCKDFFKKRRLDTVPFDDTIKTVSVGGIPNPEQRLTAIELGAAITRAVAKLPEKHRTAFILREYEGLSYKEMAEVIQCSVGTVMSRLHHARKKLQGTLVEMGVTEDL